MKRELVIFVTAGLLGGCSMTPKADEMIPESLQFTKKFNGTVQVVVKKGELEKLENLKEAIERTLTATGLFEGIDEATPDYALTVSVHDVKVKSALGPKGGMPTRWHLVDVKNDTCIWKDMIISNSEMAESSKLSKLAAAMIREGLTRLTAENTRALN